MLRTGPGYSAAVKFRTPQGKEGTETARSRPGLAHPEWQLHDRLEQLGIRREDVLELYTELETCAVPGGNCAAQVVGWWPNVKVSHSAGYGVDRASRQRGLAALKAHLVEEGRRRGYSIDVETHGLPLPPSAQPTETAVGELSVRTGAAFPPFFEPAENVETLTGYADRQGVVVPEPVTAEYDQRGYLRTGTDFGREICVDPSTGQVWAIALRSGHALYVNQDTERFVAALELLRRSWPQRVGLGPGDAAAHTAEFQQELATIDGTAFNDVENWWSVIVEQFWDGLL